MKLSRRTFTHNMIGSLLTFSLVQSLNNFGALSHTIQPIVRKWLIEMESVTHALRAGKIKPSEWQQQIESLLSRVELKDLLSAIDYDRLAKNAIFPDDHESADDVELSRNDGLPTDLSFSPYFYAMRKGVAIIPHGHRNMTSMHLMLKGEAHLWQFERLSDEERYLTIKPTGDRALGVGALTTMSGQKDNIHWFKALSEPVFMFNIGVFRINPSEEFSGRDCVDPLGGEKLKDGLIRARRIDLKEAYKLYGRS